jgi:hypothetical protein
MSDDHNHEIERRDTAKAYRVNCTCGFLGPWRKTRRTARKDADDHIERMLERHVRSETTC